MQTTIILGFEYALPSAITSQITMAVGYEDVSAFTKLLRRKTGLPSKDDLNKLQRRSLG